MSPEIIFDFLHEIGVVNKKIYKPHQSHARYIFNMKGVTVMAVSSIFKEQLNFLFLFLFLRRTFYIYVLHKCFTKYEAC